MIRNLFANIRTRKAQRAYRKDPVAARAKFDAAVAAVRAEQGTTASIWDLPA